jgi:hypothetical protein
MLPIRLLLYDDARMHPGSDVASSEAGQSADPRLVVAPLPDLRGLVLVNPTVLSHGRRAAVWRYQVESGAAANTAIVKMTDPDSSEYRDELAAYLALSGCPTGAGRVPRLLGASPQRGILVLEDLSQATCLLDVLLGEDEGAAGAALDRISFGLGAVQAAARRRLRDYRIRLGDVPPAFMRQAAALDRAHPAIAGLLSALGIPFGDTLTNSLLHLSARIAEPRACTTITVGDMAPTNILITRDEVLFIDLEFAGERHPFYDAMFWRGLCSFPPAVCDGMERMYRLGLAEAGWSFDDDAFDCGMIDAAADRLFTTLGWASTASLIHADRSSPPTRPLVLRYLTEFLRLVATRSCDPAFVEAASRCLGVLLSRWGDCRAEAAFPAFAG